MGGMTAHRKHFIDGVPATEVATKHGVDPQTFYRRVGRGWTIERAATEPMSAPGSPLRVDDGRRAIEVAARNGIPPWVVHQRLADEWKLRDAVTVPNVTPTHRQAPKPLTSDEWEAAVLASVDLDDDDGWFHVSTATGPRALRKVARYVASAPPEHWNQRIERCTVGTARKVMLRWTCADCERSFRTYDRTPVAAGIVGTLERARQESLPLQDEDGWFPANAATGPRVLRSMVQIVNAAPDVYADVIESRVAARGKRSWRWLVPIGRPIPDPRERRAASPEWIEAIDGL